MIITIFVKMRILRSYHNFHDYLYMDWNFDLSVGLRCLGDVCNLRTQEY